MNWPYAFEWGETVRIRGGEGLDGHANPRGIGSISSSRAQEDPSPCVGPGALRVGPDPRLTSRNGRTLTWSARRELLATSETVRKRSVDTSDALTPQEAQIARLAAGGESNPEIGSRLFISPRTAEYHLSKVFVKLSVKSRRELRTAIR